MKLKEVTVPYPMPPVFSQEKRHKYMLACMQNKFPKLLQRPKRDDPISLVAYGPSLMETWKDLKPTSWRVRHGYCAISGRSFYARSFALMLSHPSPSPTKE